MRGGPQIWLYYFLLPVPGCKMILLMTPRILEIKADHQLRTDSRIPDAWKTEQHLPDPTQRGHGARWGGLTGISELGFLCFPAKHLRVHYLGDQRQGSVQPHTCFSRWWTV